jgi:hypothetical protein
MSSVHAPGRVIVPQLAVSAPKHDEIRLDDHRALSRRLSVIFPENRCTLFRIML